MTTSPPTSSVWAACLVSIRFDLDLGPKIEYVTPHDALTEDGKLKIIQMAFPDCNPDCAHHFIFNFSAPDCTVAGERIFNETVATPAGGTTLTTIYGAAYYRQKRDPSVPRGYVQQVVVLLSRLPFIAVHELILRVVVPRFAQCCQLSPDTESVAVASALAPRPSVYFPMDPSYNPAHYSQEQVLDEAMAELAAWPTPHPRVHYEVTLLHQALEFVTPARSSRPPRAQLQNAVRRPPMHLDERTRLLGSAAGGAGGGASSLAGGLGGLVSSVEDVLPLYGLLGDHVHYLTHLWELVICHEPIFILSNTPSTASAAALAVASLVAPIEYSGRVLAYLTVLNEQLARLSRMGKTIPFAEDTGLIAAGTNPLFLRSFEGWRSFLVVLDRFTGPGALPLSPPPSSPASVSASAGGRGALLRSHLPKSNSSHKVYTGPSSLEPLSAVSTGTSNGSGAAGALVGRGIGSGSFADPSRTSSTLASAAVSATSRPTAVNGNGGSSSSSSSPGVLARLTNAVFPQSPRSTQIPVVSTSAYTAAAGLAGAYDGVGDGARASPTCAMTPTTAPTPFYVDPVAGPRRSTASLPYGSSIVPRGTADVPSGSAGPIAADSPVHPSTSHHHHHHSSNDTGNNLPYVHRVPIGDDDFAGRVYRVQSSSSSSPTDSPPPADLLTPDPAAAAAVGEASDVPHPLSAPGGVADSAARSPSARSGGGSSGGVASSASSTQAAAAAPRMERNGQGSQGGSTPALSVSSQRQSCPPLAPGVSTCSASAVPPCSPLFTPHDYDFLKASAKVALTKRIAKDSPGNSRAKLQHSLRNYFDSSFPFLLDHAEQTAHLMKRLEAVSRMDEEAQHASVSLHVTQCYNSGQERKAAAGCAPTGDAATANTASSPSGTTAAAGRMDVFGEAQSSPYISTVFAQYTVADDMVRKFFVSLTNSFLTPVTAWFASMTDAVSAFHLCDRSTAEQLLSRASFLAFLHDRHREFAPLMWTRHCHYKTYKVAYERFAGGCLFATFVTQLVDRKLRREVDSFDADVWAARFRSEPERIDMFINLFKVVQQELARSLDPDVVFVTSATSVLAGIAVSISAPLRDQFMLKIEDLRL